MAGLEAVLRISAQDDTAAVLAGIKEKILGIEKTAAQMDKFVASVGRVTRATDPLAGSLMSAERALSTQRNEIRSVVGMLDRMVGPTDRAAAAQRNLTRSVETASRALAQQGRTARTTAGAIAGEGAAGRRGAHGGGILGALPLLGIPTGAHALVKAVEGGADLDQLRFRITAAGGGGESAAADRLATGIAARFPGLTNTKILETYQELRANALNPDGTLNAERAATNLITASRAQVAAQALGVEMTPHDMQNLLKSMEGTGRANDPTALGKTFDTYLRAKQMYGSAINTESLLNFVQNAKSANFGLSDSVFYGSIWARLAEGNAARLGNEFSQTMQTLVGGHMTKQGAEWLVSHGLIDKGQIVSGGGGGKFYVKGGIKNAAMLSADPTTWADAVMFPAIKSSGVLDDAKVAARMRLMSDEERKRTGIAPNEEAIRERAQAGLISDNLYKSGFRGTVVDQIAHAIVNAALINRDTAGMAKLPGSEIAADVGKNPVAAFGELTTSISNFASVLTSPAVAAAAPALDAVAHGISNISNSLMQWEKEHPQAATAASGGAMAAGAAGVLWLGYKMYGLVSGIFGGGGGAAAGGVAGEAAGGGLLGGLGSGAVVAMPWMAGAAALVGLYEELKNFNPPKGITDEMLEKSRRSGMVAHPGGFVYDPEAHHGAALSRLIEGGHTTQEVNVHGEAEVRVPITITVNATSELISAVADAKNAANASAQIPLNPVATGHSGRMDSDASPLGHGGIGAR